MPRQPRIDLDGIPLSDPDTRETTALLRYRTAEGLVIRQPESVDRVVPWAEVEAADLDLMSGQVRLRFSEAFAARSNWLRGARELVGRWTDRAVLHAEDVGLRRDG